MKALTPPTLAGLAWLAGNLPAFAQAAQPVAGPPPQSLPDAGAAFIRVLGALALVISLFLAGVWAVRNWQRVSRTGGPSARLNLLESRALGNRHCLHVVGYERERFLVASWPGGVSLLSHLASAPDNAATAPPAPPSFAQALTQVLKGQGPGSKAA